MTMVERAVVASDKAGDAYIATLPERLDQRPPGWRRTLATARMSAALQAALDGPDVVERLAEIEHARWARWQEYLHSQCSLREIHGERCLIIPADRLRHWER